MARYYYYSMVFDPVANDDETRSVHNNNALVEIHDELELQDEAHSLKEKIKIEANRGAKNVFTEYSDVEAKPETKFWKDVTDEIHFDFNEPESRTEELYSDHVIKEELVVGPRVFHKPVLISNDNDVNTTVTEPLLETAVIPVEAPEVIPIAKPLQADNCHEVIPCKEIWPVTSTSTLVKMGELATSPPKENVDLFHAIIKIIDQHYPKNWRDWKVYNLTLPELLGEEISTSLESKIRFALPTLDLACAFNLLTSSLSASTYRTIRSTLIKWPLARALIYTPQWVASRIHGASYGDLVNTVKVIRPKLALTRKMPLKHSNINRKRPYPTSDFNKTPAKKPNITKPAAEKSSAESSKHTRTTFSTVHEQNERIPEMVRKTTKEPQQNLDSTVKARPDSTRSKSQHAMSKSTSLEEWKKLKMEIAQSEQYLAKLQRVQLLRVAQQQTIARRDPKLVYSIPESNSNRERRKILQAEIADAEIDLAKLQNKRVLFTQESTIAKKNPKLIGKEIPVNPMSNLSNPRKERLRAMMAETEPKTAKLQRIRLRQVRKELTTAKTDPKLVNLTPDSTSSNKREEVRSEIKAVEGKIAELQKKIKQLRASKEKKTEKANSILVDATPDRTLGNERMEALKAKIAETDRKLGKLRRMKELQVVQDQTGTKPGPKSVNPVVESTSSNEPIKTLLEKNSKAENGYKLQKERFQVTKLPSMATADPKWPLPESTSASNERMETLLANIAKAEQEFTKLRNERPKVTREQSAGTADPTSVNGIPESMSSNERMEMLLAKIAKAELEYSKLQKERSQDTQEQSVVKVYPQPANAVLEDMSYNKRIILVQAKISETVRELADLQRMKDILVVQEQAMEKADPKLKYGKNVQTLSQNEWQGFQFADIRSQLGATNDITCLKIFNKKINRLQKL